MSELEMIVRGSLFQQSFPQSENILHPSCLIHAASSHRWLQSTWNVPSTTEELNLLFLI